jgi:ketosteroid isomerase-like protein
MPSRERVEAFIASVVAGDHVRAIADYYHEDASMQENLQPPRRGRDALMAHEAKVLQRWAGDRIAEERFVYDAATAWTVVDG